MMLRGEADGRSEDLVRLSLALSARIVALAGVESSLEAAGKLVRDKLDSGEAFELFKANCELQGGDIRVCDEPSTLLDKNLVEFVIKAKENGTVGSVDALAIGESIVEIGGGRNKADDPIDHAVGFACTKKIGDAVAAGETMGILYCRDDDQVQRVCGKLEGAFKISQHSVSRPELIKAVI
jgi:thymidine phosphorylase